VGDHFLASQDVVNKDFVQLTYTDAVELLVKSKKKFEFPVILFLMLNQSIFFHRLAWLCLKSF